MADDCVNFEESSETRTEKKRKQEDDEKVKTMVQEQGCLPQGGEQPS